MRELDLFQKDTGSKRKQYIHGNNKKKKKNKIKCWVLDIWSQQSQAMPQAWGRMAGRLCREKESGSIGQSSADHELVLCPGGQPRSS